MSCEAELPVMRIVSGGQTGVDRGALDAALALGISHGGWCPRGRLAEDGVIPWEYNLQETDSFDYKVRTEWNVQEADATLILYRRALRGGTEFTRRMAIKHGKPYRTVDLARRSPIEPVREWLIAHGVRVLNVAGPRASSSPGIQQQARKFMIALLRTD